MENNIKVFNSEEFGQVRTVLKDDNVWFVAKDIAEILGYQKLDAMYRLLEEDEQQTINPQGFPQLNGIVLEPNPNVFVMKLINESGLYNAVFSSTKPTAKKFKKWVTSEVLPAIRKTGGYVAENRAIDFVNNWLPSLDETSKNAIASVLEENRKLVLKIEQDKPLVEFAETISISSDSIDIGTFAKIIKDENINLGRNKLFEWLRNNKYLMKDNEPYQKYINEKYFQVEEYTANTPYGTKLCKKTVVTGLGQIKLVQKLKSEFGLKGDN